MNRGAQILSGQLSKRGAQSELSKRLALDEGYISRIARGVRVPGLKTRRALEKSQGIPMQLWDEPPKEEEATDAAE